MSVIVMIEGREAIPVRAIPLLTYWETMSSDALVMALAGDEHFYHFEGLQAFRLRDRRVIAIPATYWENVALTKLEALSDRIGAVEVSHKAGLDEWRSESLKVLPAGVFVWRDDFEPLHCARYRDSMTFFKHLETGEVMGPEEQERRTQLDFDPLNIGMGEERIIMEGFEPQATTPSPSPVVTESASGGVEPETPKQRRARWLLWHGEAGEERGALQRVFEREQNQNPKADRSFIGKEIKRAEKERAQLKRDGNWVAQLVQDGRRKG